MKASTARTVLWFMVPPAECYYRWGAKRYHLNVATGLFFQTMLCLSLFVVIASIQLAVSELTWKTFMFCWVIPWIVFARHMNQSLDRLRMGLNVGVDTKARWKVQNLLVWPLVFLRLSLVYLAAAVL
jgi:hypothetical protein